MPSADRQPARQTERSGPERASDGAIPPQALFREVNERIEALAEEFGVGAGAVSLVCECADNGCLEQIEIAAADYEQLRRFPTHFLVKPGHADRQSDRIVSETSGYVIVEKTGRDAAEAVRLDPRRPTPRTGGSR